MAERLVRTCWWLLLNSFIAAGGIAAVYCCYRGLADVLWQQWSRGGLALILGLLLAGATWCACRHRIDLLYG